VGEGWIATKPASVIGIIKVGKHSSGADTFYLNISGSTEEMLTALCTTDLGIIGRTTVARSYMNWITEVCSNSLQRSNQHHVDSVLATTTFAGELTPRKVCAYIAHVVLLAF